MGMIPPDVGLVLVATLECAIEIGFLFSDQQEMQASSLLLTECPTIDAKNNCFSR